MRYLLLIYSAETSYAGFSGQELQEFQDRHTQLKKDAQAAGVFIDSQRLEPVASAKSLVIRGEKQLLTDGPFAETKEQLGGFYYIDVETPEEALAWAARIPQTDATTVEIRPIMQM
jgi:hypothetical protein